MSATMLALDLGTGGCKASLWNAEGSVLAETFCPYVTAHPQPGWSEQSVHQWWEAIAICVRQSMSQAPSQSVDGIAISGHSLGFVMLDRSGNVIEDSTPIWSDTRAVDVTREALSPEDESRWYLRTGNGFTPALYPAFKALWYKRNRPESWSSVRTIVGCKDWVNYRLTGRLATDHSYASGSGAYDLFDRGYSEDLTEIGGLSREVLPEIIDSHEIVGTLAADSARELGLPSGIPVFAGAVDNSAMALGSRCTRPGRVYAALGSSSWITAASRVPVLDLKTRPYVFAHVIPGLFISALSTFSSGTSMTWLRHTIAPELSEGEFIDLGAELEGAENIPIFVPTLAGGTPLEGGPEVRGVIAGLDLSHGKAELARAGMEGIAFSLRRSLELLSSLTTVDETLLVSGGGARSKGWNQLYADVLESELVLTDVDQQAAALGAAAVGFVGLGAWSHYSQADNAHTEQAHFFPEPASIQSLVARRGKFEALASFLARTHGTLE